MSISNFKGKKVIILGLSVEGFDCVKFFAEHDALVTCADRRTKQELGNTYDLLKKYNVTFQLGKSYLTHLDGYYMYVKTPGMSPRLPQITALKKSGKEITSLTKLFFNLCKAPIVGVTGTKGKGTTSTLIFQMLKQSGKRVYLGGNVGVPLLSQVDVITAHDVVVLELSSFQLEDLTKSPHVAVVLKITQDHLANYDPLATNMHESRQDYIQAKKSIVRFQTPDDFVIANADDPTSNSFASETPARALRFSRNSDTSDAFVKDHAVFLNVNRNVIRVCDSSDIKLRGEHNLENIAASALTAFTLGCSIEEIHNSVISFEGLEHRLQLVGSIKGVSYYNDSFSTIPETTIAAIESFTEPIILIAGGSEKGSDFNQMGKIIAESSVKVLIAIGAMSKRIVHAATNAGFKGKIITYLTTMHEVVSTARFQSQSGDIVLLSPGCASFDMFKNYKERGNIFTYEVSLLKN
ncbi:UDP-N-acetylmuramoyl-L-alanine--D-glutamate ligase [Candidatus Gottesmanbacteria bacterium]|nr:UDP-N-acetylmuramoyl-L-alanine--D-glutamate ligase [Candidatus Gottesmanbacteria bacterium]